MVDEGWAVPRVIGANSGPIVDADRFDAVGTGIRADGAVVSWGRPPTEQFSDLPADSTNAGDPVTIDAIPAATRVFLGGRRTYLYTRSGALWYWGLSEAGDYRFRAPVASDFLPPRTVEHTPGLSSFCGNFDSTCAVRPDGHVVCWGMNSQQFISPSAEGGPRPETEIAGLRDVVGMGCSRYTACALRRNGTVACWGSWAPGSGASSPFYGIRGVTEVPGISGAIQIAVGDAHLCVLSAEHRVRCIGDDQYGQSRVDLGDVASVGAGESHSCALLRSGEVWCWGRILEVGASNGGSAPRRVAIP
jgi:alpha-tubulin suppressor-like RCC1 family protein